MKKNNNLIYGIRAVIEAIDAGHDLERLFVQKQLKGELIKDLFQRVRESNITVTTVPLERLNKFTRKNHQGVVAFLSPVKYHNLPDLTLNIFESGKVPFIAILDRVTDVRNFGAIARSAEACGVDALVISPRHAAQINSDSMKTSAGALSSLPVCREKDLSDAVRYLKNSGLTIVGCSEKGKEKLSDRDLTGPIALILGSEEDGISDDLVGMCDHLLRIPMSGKIASLNVSAAAAICFYEVIRQRG
jgi:23S rRNA (guanosine2251-2'-O)-methyltransferase